MKKQCGIILMVTFALCILFSTQTLAVSVSDIKLYTQNSYTGWSIPGYSGRTLKSSGCVLFAYAHAIEWLTGTSRSDDLITELVTVCSDPNGLYGHPNCTHGNKSDVRALAYKNHIKTKYSIEASTSVSKTETSLQNYLTSGGVVILRGPAGTNGGHIVVAVGFARNSSGTAFLHIIDSHPYSFHNSSSKVTYYNSSFNAWSSYTQNAADYWLKCSDVVSNGKFVVWNGLKRTNTQVTSISLKGVPTTEAGGSFIITPTIMPENATNKAITWSSSDTSLATVDSSGKVTTNSNGKTGYVTIRATASDGSGVVGSMEVPVFPYKSSENFICSGTFLKNDASAEHPYSSSRTMKHNAGESFTVVKKAVNNFGNQWFQLSNGYWVVDSDTIELYGDCGENAEWRYSNGQLSIYGSGHMTNYTQYDQVPWSRIASGITNLVVHNEITSFGDYSMYNCVALENVSFPDSITNIGAYSFRGCKALKHIDLPDSVTSFGYDAFDGCNSLLEFVFPSKLTYVAGRMLEDCHQIKEYVIPDSVHTIREKAFKNNIALEKITIPSSVTSIADDAFENCGKVSIICYRGSAAYTFATARNITCVTLDEVDEFIKMVNNIRGAADVSAIKAARAAYNALSTAQHELLYDSDAYDTLLAREEDIAWSDVDLSEAIEYMELVNGGRYDLNYEKQTAIFYKAEPIEAKSLTIEDVITVNGKSYKVTEIAENACYGMPKLTKLTIGKNVRTIGKSAFNSCRKLTTIKGGAGVTTIKENAFMNDIKLKTVPSFGKLKTIGASAFNNCTAMTKFTISKNVNSIGKNAFYNCNKLKSIVVKSTKLTTSNVKSGAFKGINSKASIICPSGKKSNYKKLFVKRGAPSTVKFKK